jgi:formylglycine-generating enzyme required for sulfatase activity/Tol biopolymer transport system component
MRKIFPGRAMVAAVLSLAFSVTISSVSLADTPPPIGAEFRDCPDCPALIVIPGGSFEMGSAAGAAQAEADEMPQHRVAIPENIALGRYEVTRAQFAKFVAATNHDAGSACNSHESGEWQLMQGRNWQAPGFNQTPQDPVVCVSWNDAKAYVKWLSTTTGQPYRLLTESEWEYVARAGNTADGGVSHEYANYGADQCCASLAAGKDQWLKTAPVGSLAADSLGLYDVRGNVWEWLEDCYHENYVNAPTDGSARTSGCSVADHRVLRGGSWGDAGSFLRPAYRLRGVLDGRYFTLGFRVARSVAGSLAAKATDAKWDVTDTGQPFKDAEFRLTEGSWMALDVSPDGKTIAFDLLGDIYTIAASGGEATLIHGGPAMQRSPSFSADGSKLLYLSDASGSDNVWMSNADGSQPRQLTHETVQTLTGPTWGPRGESIAAALTYATADRLHASEIRSFDLRGGAGRVLVAAPKNHENVHEARFSSDGRYLYYTEKISPPSASVVYIDANHINFAIKRRDLTTGETEELLQGFGSATTPQVSPDGRRIAFVRRVKDKTVLFVYDTQTGEQRPVFDGLDRDGQSDFIGQGTYYPQFDWFPDNRHVAIWARGKLHDIDTNESSAREIPFSVQAHHRITTAPRFEQELAPQQFTIRAIRQLAFAPDNRHVVFNAIGHLWVKSLPHGKPVRLTNGQALEFEPAYSPDGRHVAYVEWDDERGSALKIAAVNGGKARTLLTNPGVLRQPSFSADGKRLVFGIDEGDKCMGGYRGKPGLYWIAAAGGEAQYVTTIGATPQFSPDGSRIYYTVTEYADEGVMRELQSVNLQGFDKRDHAQTPDADTLELRISPDLRWISFMEQQQYYVLPCRETGSPLIVTASSAAVPVRTLTSLGGHALAWSADSSNVYWTLGASLYRAQMAQPAAAASEVLAQAYTSFDLQVPADAPQGTIAFVNGRVITMQAEEVIERGTVIVTGNRITAVGPAGQVVVPPDAKVIDVAGKTLMPGLINMHGHLDDCYYSSAGLLAQKQPSHYASLAFGTTTNYDPYTSELPSYSVSEMNRAGVMVGPRSIVVGSVMYGRKGKSDSVYTPIDRYEDAQKVMERKRALGGTIIKSYRQPMRSQRQQLIKAGREAGIMVDVEGESHFYNNITMILDGHTALEHNLPLANYYDDIVQLMAHGQTATTPTLIVTFGEFMGENYFYQKTRAWEDPKLRAYVQATTSGYSPLGTPYSAPPPVRGMTTVHVAEELWDIGFRSVARSIKKLDDAGVLVNVGSHGQIHGLDSHWEMWLLAQGGMSNHRVLRAATLNGAKTLALDRQTGSLQAGKLADLVVLDANPLDDIRNTNTVRYTMVNGRLYDSLSMNEIGHYARPRGRFYWERGDPTDHSTNQWNESWSHQ